MRRTLALIVLMGLLLAFAVPLSLSSGLPSDGLHDRALAPRHHDIHVISLSELPLRHENLTAEVSRIALINYTLLIVRDNITIRATGEAELSSFLYGFPLDWAEENDVQLLSSSVEEKATGEELSRSAELRLGDLNFWGFLLSLPEPIKLHEGDSLELSAEFVFNRTLAVSYRSTTRDYEHRLEAPLYPCTSLGLSKVDFKAIMPAATTVPSTKPAEVKTKTEREGRCWCVLHNATDLAEFAAQSLRITFTADDPVPLFYCVRLVREIVLTSFGRLLVRDSYDLINRIGGEVERFNIYLPAGAGHVKASDPMGELSVTEKGEFKGLKKIRVRLRGTVKEGEPIKLTVAYELPWEDYVSREGVASFRLKMPVHVDWPVAHLLVKVVLPEGASIRSYGPGLGYLSRGLRPVVGLSRAPFTPTEGLEIEVAFTYSFLWPSFWPTAWAGLAGLVACVLVKLLSAAPPVPAAAVALPAEMIREFMDAFRRRMELRDELASLRRALRAGRISRRKYKTRSRALRDEMDRLEKKVRSLAEELRSAGGMVAELVRSLEIAEMELASVERDMRELEVMYARKETDRETYERRLRELRRREDRARVAMREALLRLEELIS